MKIMYDGSPAMSDDLKYGGRKAYDYERKAIGDLLNYYTMEPSSISCGEIDAILKDPYGRMMYYVDVIEEGMRHQPLFIVLQSVAEDGTFTASPKAILRVRDGAILSGIERQKTRNNWECPLDPVWDPTAE